MPVKKTGQERSFSLLLYYVPSFVLHCFERPKVNVYMYLVLAFEVPWYPPRVPANAASAILESAGGKYVSCLIDNLQFRGGKSLSVLRYRGVIAHTCPAND